MTHGLRWAVRTGAFARLLIALLLSAACSGALAGKSGGNQPPTVSLTSPANGASYVAPATVNLAATASDPDGTVTRVDFYQGNTLIGTAFSPPYTATWNNVAQGNYTLTAKATDNGGAVTTSASVAISVASATALVVTSPADGASIHVGAQLTVTGTFEGPEESTILVDNEQSSILATVSGNTYTATFAFTQRLAVGANTITVRLARPNGTSATRTLTVTGYDNPYVALTGPSCGTFDAPASILLSADAKVPGGTVTQVQFFQGSTLLGTVTNPPYQFAWNNVPVGTYSVTARATSNFGATTTSAPMQISVLGPNTPPTISITAPTNGASFTAPATVAITVNASDPDPGGSVKTVEYFQNGNLFAVSNVPPFGTTWLDVPAGSYAITARATDDRNGQTTSAPVNISVNPPTQPPIVSLTAPANGSTFVVSSNVTLSANASDPDGTISKVEFYTGTTLIGTSTTPPYSVVWNAITPGANALTARAYDNFNVSTTSAPVNVTITGAITYLHSDFAGNPIAATDASGAIVWKENFRPYGDRLNNQPAASGNRQWFHGKSVDADTGLSYFGARYYDATLGRFMGVDPQHFSEDSLQSFNRYQYGNNNPQNFIDPNGAFSLPVLAVTAFVVTVSIVTSSGGFQSTRALPGLQGFPGKSESGATILTTPGEAQSGQRLPGFLQQVGDKLDNLIFSRGSDKLGPVRDAEGPHTTWRTDPKTGEITRHETWVPNAQNPTGWDSNQSTDVVGRKHFNKETGVYVPTPHTQGKDIAGGVRPATKDEIPKPRNP